MPKDIENAELEELQHFALPIEIRLYRKGTYILADIHGMDHFCTKLAPPPYNKPRSCVSKIHTPMVMVWFGNVSIFNNVEFPTVLIYVTSEKIRKKPGDSTYVRIVHG
jgi:hypothetical protein